MFREEITFGVMLCEGLDLYLFFDLFGIVYISYFHEVVSWVSSVGTVEAHFVKVANTISC